MKNNIKSLCQLVIILLLTFSCKNEKSQKEDSRIFDKNSIKVKEVERSFLKIDQIIGKNLITIVNRNSEYMLSCAKKYNLVKLNKNDLYIEIIEPISYEVKKIEETNKGFKIYFKEENFYYDVKLVDENKGIYYWKNLSENSNLIDNDYSFYTVEENKLSSLNLKKEDCSDNGVLSGNSTWKTNCSNSNGKYFIYSQENNEGSLSGELNKNYFFSVTGKIKKNEDIYEFTYDENYSSTSESDSEQFWNDYSNTEKIADITVLNNLEIEFKWYGFFNEKTKIREYLKNPFTNKIEKESIILKKCE